jgi:hypothetical protein
MYLRNLDTGLPVIQQQKRIRPPCNAMIFALTFYTRQKFTGVFTGTKIGADHTETKIHLTVNVTAFFPSFFEQLCLALIFLRTIT